MARSAGFEPATARFVAEYSIQLSHERSCVIIAMFPVKVKESFDYSLEYQLIYLAPSSWIPLLELLIFDDS